MRGHASVPLPRTATIYRWQIGNTLSISASVDRLPQLGFGPWIALSYWLVIGWRGGPEVLRAVAGRFTRLTP